MSGKPITLEKVRVHNLKGVDLRLEPNQLIVFTGVSGSGKSSLAFDTLYVEGQRRYVESLSTFARRYLGDLAKPDLEHASGLSPTIAIDQKTAGRSPRSTVGTMTEIYDYLRVLFARVATAHCPESGEPVTPLSREAILATIREEFRDQRLQLLAPVARGKKGEFKDEFQGLQRRGFVRVRVDGDIVSLDEEVALDGSVAHDVEVVVDRLLVTSDNDSRLTGAVTTALELGEGLCIALTEEREQLFSMHAFSKKSNRSYRALQPQDFSFNSPTGMCEGCQGLGVVEEFDLDAIIDPDKSIAEDCCAIASSYQTVRYGNIYRNLARHYRFKVDTPWHKLTKRARKIFLYGADKKWLKMRFVHPKRDTSWTDYVRWHGVLHEAHQRLAQAQSDHYRQKMGKLMRSQACPHCQGERLAPYPAAARLSGKGIAEITGMSIADAHAFFSQLKLPSTHSLIASELLKEIRERLSFLIDVGLHYLSLGRTAPTLSGGEAQRVRLAAQVGCGLVGITYVLDEPSIGLHPRDNQRLLTTLEHLRDRGNTVIVVEHDEETMRRADRIVDFGPGAGSEGGQIVVDGSLKELLKSKESLTGAYLSGRRQIAVPERRRHPSGELWVRGATHHNLKAIDVRLPLGLFIAVTGVSGSGKSSLVTDTLYPALANALHRADHDVGKHRTLEGLDAIDKVIAIDQSPIGRNPRSNPATYVKLFDEIRDLFCQLPASRAHGYKPGRFSFNVREGSCTHCSGMGATRIDMDFMEDAWVTCPACQGHRFDAETLAVRYKDRSIHDVLEMTIQEASGFFANIPSLMRKLEALLGVGLGYLKLGQPSPTLSGGEAQRIKLAKELARPATGKTLYILDEPTTGLHFYDIDHLLDVLHALVERGNTVLVIEHNMDVIKTADWLIDLGPDGGDQGGQIVAEGTPEQIAHLDTPTGVALRANPQVRERPPEKYSSVESITIEGASQNNLRDIDVKIPRGQVTVCTGPSGSGKSSLAFETLFAEGQRRYVESLSPYARQFVQQSPKPKVASVEGLSPAIAIEQKIHAGNPRSTVGTLTEIYDYLRILYARAGTPHCPETGEVIRAISKEHVIERLLARSAGERFLVLAPLKLGKGMRFEELTNRLARQGFLRLRLNGTLFELDQPIPFDRRRRNQMELVIDRLKTGPTIRARLSEAIEVAAKIGEDQLVIAFETEELTYNLAFSVEKTGKSYPPITPHSFSFNRPDGMCSECQGLGVDYGANLMAQEDLAQMKVRKILEHFWGDEAQEAVWLISQLIGKKSLEQPLHKLDEEMLKVLLNGSDEELEFGRNGWMRWRGLQPTLAKLGKAGREEVRAKIARYLSESPCSSCKGERLNPLARHVTLQGHSLGELCHLPSSEVLRFFEQLELSSADQQVLAEVHRQLLSRLRFLCEVGLDHLALHRSAPTLSNGEAQRIRLARQLGSSLSGVLYVLDEPTVGLHPQDSDRLNNAIEKLKKLGNTIVMVEHDPLTISKADHLIDFGPGAGTKGGQVVAMGSLDTIKSHPSSLTGAYLSGRRQIATPETRRTGRAPLIIENASRHNLKDLSLCFPVGAFTCVTGASGAGKSTLVSHLLAPAVAMGIKRHDVVNYRDATVRGIDALDRLVVLDQNPIGRTARSDVCTYVDLMTLLRRFYAKLPKSVMHGLQPRHFSANHRKGMCSACRGLGYKSVELQFLPAVRINCDRCQGMRLNPLALQVEYAGLSLGRLFSHTVAETRELFAHDQKMVRILDTLIAVGLGYLTLGQEVASLSGGEAQRLKISRELSKRSTKRTLYILDEPTTGLHYQDVELLLAVLHRLVDQGSTLITIEHNLDFIKQADLVIDLGPGAGDAGGYLLAAGTPEEIAAHPESITGRYLASMILEEELCSV